MFPLHHPQHSTFSVLDVCCVHRIKVRLVLELVCGGWGLRVVEASAYRLPLAGEASSSILWFSFSLVQSFVMSSKWLSKSTSSVWSPDSSIWVAMARVSSHCLSMILLRGETLSPAGLLALWPPGPRGLAPPHLLVLVFERPFGVLALVDDDGRNPIVWRHFTAVNLEEEMTQAIQV